MVPTSDPTPCDGDLVRSLQGWLAQLGFSLGPMDGDFGPRIEAAVRLFQASAGLAVDGIAGPEPFGHLYGGLIADQPGTPTVARVKDPKGAALRFIAGAKRTVLRRGPRFRGAFVVLLQAVLNRHGAGLAEDGDFGALTERAVKSCQREHRLGVDGIVGPQTWGSLIP